MAESLFAHVGDDLYDRDGQKIGVIADVISEPRTLEPAWFAVKTGRLHGRHLVPVGAVTRQEGHAAVPFEKAQVDHAPKSDGTSPTETQQEELYEHYGWRPGNHRAA